MGRCNLWIPIVAVAGAITVASHIPGPLGSALLGAHHVQGENVAHLLLYTFLGFSVARCLKVIYGIQSGGLLLLTGALCVSCGVVDEWHQTFVPERSAEFWDLFLDGIGGVGGGLVYSVGSWALRELPEPQNGMHTWRSGWKRGALRLAVAGLVLGVASVAVYDAVTRAMAMLPHQAGAAGQFISTHRLTAPSNGREGNRSAGAPIPAEVISAGPRASEHRNGREPGGPGPVCPLPAPQIAGSAARHAPGHLMRYHDTPAAHPPSAFFPKGHPAAIRVSSASPAAGLKETVVLEGIGGYVIIHADNPVTELTQDDVRGIFSGGVPNWRYVGGPDLPIQVLIGGLGSSEVFLRQLKTAAAVDARRVPFAGLAIALIDQIPGAVGFVRIAQHRNIRLVEKSSPVKRIRIVENRVADSMVIAPLPGGPWMVPDGLFVSYPLWQTAPKGTGVDAALASAAWGAPMGQPFGYVWRQRSPQQPIDADTAGTGNRTSPRPVLGPALLAPWNTP